MAGVVFANMKMKHDRDPAEVIREEVGNIEDVDVFHNLVLIGIYKRPSVLASGLELPASMKNEDVFQGVVGLVLKVGPAAFKNDANNDFHDVSVKEGDWVLYRPADTWLTSFNKAECRMIEDAKIKGRVGHPDRVW